MKNGGFDASVTLYTGPNPPSPSLFLTEKLSVALDIVAKSNVGSSESSFDFANTFSSSVFPLNLSKKQD